MLSTDIESELFVSQLPFGITLAQLIKITLT